MGQPGAYSDNSPRCGFVESSDPELDINIGDSPDDTNAVRDEKVRAWMAKNPGVRTPFDVLRAVLGCHWTKEEREGIVAQQLDKQGPIFSVPFSTLAEASCLADRPSDEDLEC